jgi:hypothetical protein
MNLPPEERVSERWDEGGGKSSPAEAAIILWET